jgi:sporulation-control protein spo0M
LLTSEAGALVHIAGDEARFEVTVAVPDRTPAVIDHADAWVRWAIHNAGIRGTVRRLD